MLRLAAEDAKTEGANVEIVGLIAAPENKHMK